jgi:hypothetical protein
MNHPDAIPMALLVSRGLDDWVKRSQGDVDRSLVANLTSLYAAATYIIEAIDLLVGVSDLPSRDQVRMLLQIQTWLYRELPDYAETLRVPLESAIRNIYGTIPDEELE